MIRDSQDSARSTALRVRARSIALAGAFLLLAGTSGCRRQPAPNVLLITMDTARADAFGAYGARFGATPAVDRLAAGGVTFEHAVSPVPLTLPAHASLMTGTFPPRHSVRENGGHPLPEELTTMAELFRAKGYRTGAFVGAYVLDARWGLSQGFDSYSASFDASPGDAFSLADLQRSAGRVADDALAWLGAAEQKPFLAWIHLYDPHAPYAPPGSFERRFEDPYIGEIAYADSQIDRVLRALDEGGALENTVVVFAADHGEGFGEHGENGHGLLLYEESVRVPLIVSAPGRVAEGRRVTTPVSLIDVLPTIAELAGIETPARVQGHTLVPLMRGADAIETPIYSETIYPRSRFGWSELRALRTGPLKLIDSSVPEIYDVSADPREERDLAASREDLLRRNLHALRGALAEIERDPATPGAAAADQEAREKLAALGYISGAAVSGAPGRALPPPRAKIEIANQVARARGDLVARRYPEAEARLLDILRGEPAMLEAQIALGETYLRSKRPAEAVHAFRKALSLSGRDPAIVAALASAEIQMGNAAEATALLDAVIPAGPPDPRLHFVAGRAALARRDMVTARKHFEAMRQLNPRAAAALVELAGIAIANDDPARAKELARAALQIDARAPGARLFLAQALESEGKTAEAWQKAHEEMKDSPDDFRATYYLAQLAARVGRESETETLLRRTIQIEPRFVSGYLSLARYFLAQERDFEEGIALTQKALELRPAPGDEALARFLLADFYSRTGRHDLSRANAARGRALAMK